MNPEILSLIITSSATFLLNIWQSISAGHFKSKCCGHRLIEVEVEESSNDKKSTPTSHFNASVFIFFTSQHLQITSKPTSHTNLTIPNQSSPVDCLVDRTNSALESLISIWSVYSMFGLGSLLIFIFLVERQLRSDWILITFHGNHHPQLIVYPHSFRLMKQTT